VNFAPVYLAVNAGRLMYLNKLKVLPSVSNHAAVFEEGGEAIGEVAVDVAGPAALAAESRALPTCAQPQVLQCALHERATQRALGVFMVYGTAPSSGGRMASTMPLPVPTSSRPSTACWKPRRASSGCTQQRLHLAVQLRGGVGGFEGQRQLGTGAQVIWEQPGPRQARITQLLAVFPGVGRAVLHDVFGHGARAGQRPRAAQQEAVVLASAPRQSAAKYAAIGSGRVRVFVMTSRSVVEVVRMQPGKRLVNNQNSTDLCREHYTMCGSEFAELKAFPAVVERESFARAAEHLGLSSSALSQTIRQLEARLEVQLLNRTTRSVAPAAAGARLHQRIAPLIRDINEAVAEASAVAGQIKGALCINTLGWLRGRSSRHGSGGFIVRNPGVTLDIVVDDTLSHICRRSPRLHQLAPSG
jgi:Bacterial regulatory helix-turn-helix protein, lysR family